MKISEFYQKNQRTFSFEFFPPKTPESETKLFETLAELKTLGPSFVSVTYGAMGTTRENTIRLVSKIKNEVGLEAAAHLTCVGHTREEIEKILTELQSRGIENIVALRGDPPKGETQFQAVEGGFRYAAELVAYIRKHPKLAKSFALAVAGYPEGHLECRDLDRDMAHLKAKVEAGADVIITQLFFDNDDYFRFVECARSAGIGIPIVPGIMPVTLGSQIEKFAQMCGSKIPDLLAEPIRRAGGDQKAIEAFGIEYATRQCEGLLAGGAPGLHFYTLNKSRATSRIYANLGLVEQG